jgi:hypothetical protein
VTANDEDRKALSALAGFPNGATEKQWRDAAVAHARKHVIANKLLGCSPYTRVTSSPLISTAVVETFWRRNRRFPSFGDAGRSGHRVKGLELYNVTMESWSFHLLNARRPNSSYRPFCRVRGIRICSPPSGDRS